MAKVNWRNKFDNIFHRGDIIQDLEDYKAPYGIVVEILPGKQMKIDKWSYSLRHLKNGIHVRPYVSTEKISDRFIKVKNTGEK